MADGKAWINGGRKEVPGSLTLLDFSSKWNLVSGEGLRWVTLSPFCLGYP